MVKPDVQVAGPMPSGFAVVMSHTATWNMVDGYQPWWTLMAHLFAALGRETEAAHAQQQAAGLTEDPAVRALLLRTVRAPHDRK